MPRPPAVTLLTAYFKNHRIFVLDRNNEVASLFYGPAPRRVSGVMSSVDLRQMAQKVPENPVNH